jgi:beta-phosphoglucomutase-like phosphatase (HAD superfamily)
MVAETNHQAGPRPLIRGLIFDFDGLILDTEVPAFESWRVGYEQHGCVLSLEMWARVLGGSGLEWDHIAYLESQTGRKLDGDDIRRHRLEHKVALIEAETALPGALECIPRRQASRPQARRRLELPSCLGRRPFVAQAPDIVKQVHLSIGVTEHWSPTQTISGSFLHARASA